LKLQWEKSITLGVVIPYFKGEKYWADLVGSLRGQTKILDQAIIVLDGPEEFLPDIVISNIAKQITVISNKFNCGVARSRNIGMSHISTDYVFFLDQDDFWESDRVELFHNEAVSSNPEVIASWYKRVNQSKVELKEIRVKEGILSLDRNTRVSTQLLSDFHFLSICAVCIRVDVMELFDSSFKSSDDQVEIVRLLERSPPLVIDKVTCYRRFHDSNQSYSKEHVFGMLIASRYYRKSSLLDKIDSRRYLSKVNMALGTENLKLGNYNKAKRYFYRSLRLFRGNYKSYVGYAFSRMPFLFAASMYKKKIYNVKKTNTRKTISN